MNINLHIEHLVLDGLSIPAHQQPQLQAALEAELSRLLTTGGLAPNLHAGGAWPSLATAPLHLTPSDNPTLLGQQIAHSVYGSLGHES